MAARRIASLTSRQVLWAAIAGNILVAVIKFVAAALTGGSAMLSEAVHSVVDSGNSILLLYGLHRAKAPPDLAHPLGYGREIYFWSFVVAVLVFALGAGLSLYEGVAHIIYPEPMRNPAINYIVLALSAMLDGGTWWIALRNFKGPMPYSALPQAIHDSKDPPSFMTLFEDSAALIGLVLALAGTYFSSHLGLPVLDGVASILIGLVLAATAVLLARETKGLLIGEGADPLIVASIRCIAQEMDGIANANAVLTVHLAPRQILVALSLEFADELKTPEIEQKVVALERLVRDMHPTVVAVFVKPQSASGFKEAQARRRGTVRNSPAVPGLPH